MKPTKTLVLLANDAKARLFANEGAGKGLTEFEDMSSKTIAEANTRYADRPGRNSAAPGVAQHGYDKAEAEHDQNQEAFLKAVVEETETRFAKGGFDRFVMAAPPSALGVLRAHLPAALKAALEVDVDKDYLHQTPAEVVKLLGDRIVL